MFVNLSESNTHYASASLKSVDEMINSCVLEDNINDRLDKSIEYLEC